MVGYWAGLTWASFSWAASCGDEDGASSSWNVFQAYWSLKRVQQNPLISMLVPEASAEAGAASAAMFSAFASGIGAVVLWAKKEVEGRDGNALKEEGRKHTPKRKPKVLRIHHTPERRKITGAMDSPRVEEIENTPEPVTGGHDHNILIRKPRSSGGFSRRLSDLFEELGDVDQSDSGSQRTECLLRPSRHGHSKRPVTLTLRADPASPGPRGFIRLM